MTGYFSSLISHNNWKPDRMYGKKLVFRHYTQAAIFERKRMNEWNECYSNPDFCLQNGTFKVNELEVLLNLRDREE